VLRVSALALRHCSQILSQILHYRSWCPLAVRLIMYKLYLLTSSEDDNNFLLLYRCWWKVFSTKIFSRKSFSFSEPEKRTISSEIIIRFTVVSFTYFLTRVRKNHRQRPLAVSCLSFRPYARTPVFISAVPTGSISVNFDTGNFYEELTYLFTPWCRVLLEQLTGLQLVKKFPAFHGTRRFITALTSVHHLSLSWASPIQSIYSHPTSWRSVLILFIHLRLGLPSGLFPSGFPTKTLYTRLSSPLRATWRTNREIPSLDKIKQKYRALYTSA